MELNKIMGNNMGNYCSEICNSDHDVFELNMKRKKELNMIKKLIHSIMSV